MNPDKRKLQLIDKQLDLMYPHASNEEKAFYDILKGIIHEPGPTESGRYSGATMHETAPPRPPDPYEQAARQAHDKSPFLYMNLTPRDPTKEEQ